MLLCCHCTLRSTSWYYQQPSHNTVSTSQNSFFLRGRGSQDNCKPLPYNDPKLNPLQSQALAKNNLKQNPWQSKAYLTTTLSETPNHAKPTFEATAKAWLLLTGTLGRSFSFRRRFWRPSLALFRSALATMEGSGSPYFQLHGSLSNVGSM